MAERCHCGHEWVTAAKEEVGKGLETVPGVALYPCVRAKRDSPSPVHLRIKRVNLYVKGVRSGDVTLKPRKHFGQISAISIKNIAQRIHNKIL